MKKVLLATVAVMGIGLSTTALADRDRRHHGYRYHDRSPVVVHKHYYGKKYHDRKHWKRHRRDHGYYRSRHRGRHYVIRHEYDDDFYKWMGGLYILNEVLHHDHR